MQITLIEALLVMAISLVILVLAVPYSVRMKTKIAELEVIQAVQRLEQDFENCRSLDQLDRLEVFIDKIITDASKKIPNTMVYRRRLEFAWNNAHWNLINMDYSELNLPQSMLPHLILK